MGNNKVNQKAKNILVTISSGWKVCRFVQNVYKCTYVTFLTYNISQNETVQFYQKFDILKSTNT